MEFTKLPKQKTYKQIIEQIIDLIISGELKSGDKLPGERALVEKLSASRSSIREAFRTLEVIGLLEVHHGGGTYVQDFKIAPFLNTIAPLFFRNMDLMGELMDFRIMLEETAVKTAAKCSNPQPLKKMTNALVKMESKDHKIAEQADIDFHMSIFSATGNRIFKIAGEGLAYLVNTSIHTSRTKFAEDKKITENWLVEHRKIFTAVKNHQPENAGKELRCHLEGVRQYMIKASSEGENV